MITKENILDLIKQYNATNDLGAFAHTFAPMFYDIEDTGDEDAVKLAYEVEAMLAALTAGAPESAFQKAMQSLFPSLSIVSPQIEVTTQQVVTYELLTKLEGVGVVGMGKGCVFVDILPLMGFGSAIAFPDTHQTNTSLPPQQRTESVTQTQRPARPPRTKWPSLEGRVLVALKA